jgi:transcriptional regulator with XRE-family HTH domain
MDQTPSSPLGEYIRRQRELQKLSMRQLTGMVGISNPYLSQIERGLREPSEKVLDALARNLEVSAETLQRRHDEQKRAQHAQDDEGDSAVDDAIRADPRLTSASAEARSRAAAQEKETPRPCCAPSLGV